MGILVDPSYVPVPPTAAVTSPDGLLSAKVDPSNGSVLLWADYSGESTLPQKVRFYRGDGTLVRSGDPAWAPGGVAVAYDHEAPIGETASYYAVPIDSDGVAGDPSDTVAVLVPWVAECSQVWVKRPDRPDLSGLLSAATFEETGRPFRAAFTGVQGSRVGVASWDVPTGLTGVLSVYTDSKLEYDAMMALFDGSPVLIQAEPERGGIPVMYALPTADLLSSRRVATGYGWGMREWSITLTECPRPATLDAPLRIPGNTWDGVPDDYATWTELGSQVGSWAELVGVDAP